VVDLTYAETEDKNEPCKCLDKSGHVCNKIAKFNKDGISYCLKHAKKTNFILSHETPSFINKQKLDKLISISEKYKINDTNIKYKKSELVSLINSHIDKNSIKSVEKKNASKIDLVTIGKNIQSNLDVLLKDEILNIQTIIIENQISPIANRMKTIQGMIAQYFIMKKSGLIEIEFVSSSNKLKDCEKGEKLTYSNRKKLGIQKCLEIVNESFSNWSLFFSKHKKKDDLADSFLQGMWYLQQ
jgi:hypothetical protein